MTETLSPRQQLLGRIYDAYAGLGWAVPTSIECVSIALLTETAEQAEAIRNSRNLASALADLGITTVTKG